MLKQHDVVSEKVHVLQPMTPQKTTCNQTMKTPTDAEHTLVRTAHFKNRAAMLKQMVYVI